MRFSQKKFCLYAFVSFCFSIAINFSAMSQSRQFWKEADPAIILNTSNKTLPVSFRAVELDITSMRQLLSSAPEEGLPGETESETIISIPMPDGTMSDFRIWETPVMAQGLAVNFPNIRTYNAEGITDQRAVARFDVTDFGFHAMIISPLGNVFVDPVNKKDARNYISYRKEDLSVNREFECGVISEPDEMETNENFSLGDLRGSGTELRTYELALACTGEYAEEMGGTVSGALSGMVSTINRVSGIYEQEAGIRLQIIENDTLLIYLNSNTDPYTDDDVGDMLDENQDNIDDVIGTQNYDIGHVFGTGGGGIAFKGCVCHHNWKAMGATGLPNPSGNAFDVDYVAHEIGHQFGADHPFNATTDACGGGNRNGSTAYEPGSGSTIMAYSGICGVNNLQTNSDPFFHSGSLDQIFYYTTQDDGNDCPVITPTGNTPPEVVVGSNYSIPLSTPFRLEGSATDADGDSLAYMWDEMDKGSACDWNAPVGQAPLFRSFKETTLPYRYFPKLYTIINNYPANVKGEVLPDYGRTIKFRFIARDHHVGGGGIDWNENNLIITVVNTQTPFRVSMPNTAMSWPVGTETFVTWDVSSTNVAPINCQNVNILLSLDGGYTYPLTLATNTANDGNEQIMMPNDVSLIGNNQARIMVQSVGNVFFDISDKNFTITSNVGVSNVVDISSHVNTYPNPVSSVVNVALNGFAGETVQVIVRNLLGSEISTATLTQVFDERVTTVDLSNQPSGIYVLEVNSSKGRATRRVIKD